METNPTKVDIFDSLDRWLPTQRLNIPIILCFLLILTKATVDTFNTKNMSYSRSSDTYIIIKKIDSLRNKNKFVGNAHPIPIEHLFKKENIFHLELDWVPPNSPTDGYEIIVAVIVVVVVISIYSEPDEVILHN
uniref:Uncharacterized protein n=1 Tax=Glossina palpalis gambiensis TaxID=67801 RepID=A0A1B0AV53_9MUSC